jgi:hypothetical protein
MTGGVSFGSMRHDLTSGRGSSNGILTGQSAPAVGRVAVWPTRAPWVTLAQLAETTVSTNDFELLRSVN